MVEGARLNTIGFWAGVCLLANNITGPGMVSIPSIFQTSGWLFPTVAFTLMGLYAGLCSLILARALSEAPGNGHFQRKLEFSNLASQLLPRWAYVLVICGLITSFQCSNMSAIVESAQTMDSTLLAVAHKTCAFVLYSPNGQYLGAFEASGCKNHTTDDNVIDGLVAQWKESADHGLSEMFAICERNLNQSASEADVVACCGGDTSRTRPGTCSKQSDFQTFKPPLLRCVSRGGPRVVTDSPFGADYVVSLGYLVVLVLTIPIVLLNLEESIWVQVLGFGLLLYCLVAWIVFFVVTGLSAQHMPVFRAQGAGSVLSSVVFNFGFVLTVPSWLSEKQPGVSVHSSVWMAIGVSAAMFLSLGLLGGMSTVDFSGQDVLAAISNYEGAAWYATLGVYLFPPAALLSGIPVISIIIRYNLVENQMCGKTAANLFAVALPWLAALVFFSGSMLADLINWSSAITFSLLNFTFPLLVHALASPSSRLSSAMYLKEYAANTRLLNDDPPDKEAVVILPAQCRSLETPVFVWALVAISILISAATFALQVASSG